MLALFSNCKFITIKIKKGIKGIKEIQSSDEHDSRIHLDNKLCYSKHSKINSIKSCARDFICQSEKTTSK